MKMSLIEKIKSKVYGINWMINYFRNDIKQSKYYLSKENELLRDTRKLGHLPEGVKKEDLKFAREDKIYLKKVLKNDRKQLKKWQKIRSMMYRRKLKKVI
jgi:hypothetical protein